MSRDPDDLVDELEDADGDDVRLILDGDEVEVRVSRIEKHDGGMTAYCLVDEETRDDRGWDWTGVSVTADQNSDGSWTRPDVSVEAGTTDDGDAEYESIGNLLDIQPA